MSIKLVLEFDTQADLVKYLGGKGQTAAAANPKGAAPPQDEPADEDVSEGITYEEVSALVVRLSKEKGRDTAVNFLKGFKNPANGKAATKGAEIAPKDYPKAKADAEALLAEDEDVS